MGFPGKVKFPIVSNHFAKCGHKGELSAVFSAIYYLKITRHVDNENTCVSHLPQVNGGRKLLPTTMSLTLTNDL